MVNKRQDIKVAPQCPVRRDDVVSAKHARMKGLLGTYASGVCTTFSGHNCVFNSHSGIPTIMLNVCRLCNLFVGHSNRNTLQIDGRVLLYSCVTAIEQHYTCRGKHEATQSRTLHTKAV